MIEPNVLKNTLANPESDGLYSLKALHKSSGGHKDDAPAQFLRLVKTKAYVEKHNCNNQLLRTEIGVGEFGGGGDTFVSRKLVYRYAMWISDEFHDMVVDVFDNMLHNQPKEAERIVKVYTGHQPSHPNSLPALLGIPKAKSKPYFDYLRQKDIIGITYEPRAPQAIYHAGIHSDGVVIGRHGHTLLFDDNVKELFQHQTALM